MKGWGPKSSMRPSKPGKSNFFGGISRDLAGISRKCPKSLRKKRLCSILAHIDKHCASQMIESALTQWLGAFFLWIVPCRKAFESCGLQIASWIAQTQKENTQIEPKEPETVSVRRWSMYRKHCKILLLRWKVDKNIGTSIFFGENLAWKIWEPLIQRWICMKISSNFRWIWQSLESPAFRFETESVESPCITGVSQAMVNGVPMQMQEVESAPPSLGFGRLPCWRLAFRPEPCAS